MAVDVKAILRRRQELRNRASNFRSLWQELTEFMNPLKSAVTVKYAPGAKRVSPRVFDSTASDSAYTLSSSIHGSLSSSTSRWFDLEAETPELRQDPEVSEWMERSADKLFAAIQASNFDSEVQETYLDLVTVATGALLMEDEKDPERPGDFGGFRFQSLPIGSYEIATNARGLVDTIYTTHFLSLRAIDEKWPGRLPQRLRTRMATNPDEPAEVVHAVYRRHGVPERAKAGTFRRRLPYASVWVLAEDEVSLEESGYYEFCYAVCRWSTQSGEDWGRGPGELALPDTRTLNEAVKLRLQSWQLAVAPPMKYRDRGVIGRVKWAPRAMNPVRDMDAIQPIETGAKFDVANFNEERLQASIRSTFYNDKLQLPNKSIITATEANQRVRQMQRILGPALGRLDRELLAKIVDRGFSIMLRAGLFDPIPQQLLQSAKGEATNIRVRFVGPLARAQRAQDMEALAEFMNGVLPLVQVWPEVRDTINPDEYVRIAGESTSISKTILNDEKTVAKVRANRAKAAMEERKRQEQMEAAKAAGQAAPAIEAARNAMPPDGIALGAPARQEI